MGELLMYFPFVDLAIYNGLLYLIALLLVCNLKKKGLIIQLCAYSCYDFILNVKLFSRSTMGQSCKNSVQE